MIAQSFAELAEIEIPSNPFPGLRPFELHERYVFFGRSDQSEQLITKLSATRFLAVVGTSGSGKSSLVRAGLLPALFGGFMARAGSGWRVALMRPGNDPLDNLAKALHVHGVFGSEDEENRALQTAITEATLRRGSQGLIEAVQQAKLPSNDNLLVVVDQFEELFRVEQGVQSESYENEKAAFVKLILEAARQRDIPIYVVLTMRSDYLGDCAQFWDLPEAINEGQYLIPRLTREQRHEAIVGPIAVGGAEITSRLVNRLLNDMGDNPDQLPVLQHALMRTWDEWKEKKHQHPEGGAKIDLCCYEAIGGMAEALSRHADQAYNELADAHSQEIAEKLFKALTEKGPDNREVRRPITLGEICAVVEAQEPEVTAVIDRFCRPGRSFLILSADTPLTAQCLIDISHESLIRGWQRLRAWVNEEAESARMYRRLAEDTTLYAKREVGLWHDPALQLALEWRKQNRPNQAWARRYHPDFESAMAFLEQSQASREAEALEEENRRGRELRRIRIFAVILVIAFSISTVLAWYGYQQRNEALKQKDLFQQQTKIANEQTTIARASALSALEAARTAEEQKQIAEQQKQHAQTQRQKAEENEKKATESERTARQFLYAANMNLAQREYENTNFARVNELLDTHLLAPTKSERDDLRGFEWYYLWYLSHNELATLKGYRSAVLSVVFSPDGKTLATGSGDRTVKLWNTATQQELATLEGHTDAVSSVAFSPDGKTLATGSGDRTVKLWNTATQQELTTLKGHTDGVYSVAFSPDGKTLATGSRDRTVKLWNTATQQELATLKGHTDGVSSVAFSPDGKMLATGSWDRTVKLWNTATQQELATLKGHTDYVYSMAFSPDGKTLATGSWDRTVKLWNTATQQELATLKRHRDGVYSVAFSPDGKTLATGSRDRTVKLWNTATQQELTTLKGHRNAVSSVAFSPDGQILAVGVMDKTVKLWDTATQQELTTLKGHTGFVQSVAFAPDGQKLVSASDDKTVKLWNTATRQELATLKGHTDGVSSVVFSPDGKTLATGSRDRTVKLYLTATDKEVAAQKNN